MTYTIRTDSGSYEVDAADETEALMRAVSEGDWAMGKKEDALVADDAWITIFDETGDVVLTRGPMP